MDQKLFPCSVYRSITGSCHCGNQIKAWKRSINKSDRLTIVKLNLIGLRKKSIDCDLYQNLPSKIINLIWYGFNRIKQFKVFSEKIRLINFMTNKKLNSNFKEFKIDVEVMQLFFCQAASYFFIAKLLNISGQG